MRWIILTLTVFSTSCFSSVPEYKFERTDIGSHIDIRVNSVSDISLPLSLLSDAKIAGVDGLVVIFKDKSAFSVDTLSSKSLGYPQFDMRLWPSLMLGEATEGDLSEEFIEDIKRSRESLAYSNKPYKSGRFKTKNGYCYLLIGKNKSSIYLTDNSNREIITLISTTGMSEEKLQEYILQGVF